MKYNYKIKIIFICLVVLIVSIIVININNNSNMSTYITDKIINNNNDELVSANIKIVEPIIEKANRIIVYDDMTIEELTKKLNKSLNSSLSNKGNVIAKYSVKYGIDPYLATAIILHETGCKWECSYLVQKCNNVGGVKGYPICSGTGYKKYNSLDEGIEKFIINLYKNYYSHGLNSVEKINTKYASNKSWSKSINNYILEIKNK